MIWHSNLRLLTSSYEMGANKWYSNTIFFICVILAYATPSMIFLGWNPHLAGSLYIEYVGSKPEFANDTVHVSAIALLLFGAGLLGQASIATWGLCTCSIPTWSSNPLDTTYATSDEAATNRLIRRRDRCMMSVHDIHKDTQPVRPRRIQRPLLTAHPHAKWVLLYLWSLVVLSGLWGVIIYLMISRGNRNGILGGSWSFLPSFTGTLIDQCHAVSCTDGTSVLNIAWTSRSGPAGMVGTVFLVGLFQSAITLGLHCTELLVDVDQDEKLLRQAASPKGTDPRFSNMKASLKNWKKLALDGFKAVIHWMFGLSINVGYLLGVSMYPPQIFYLTGCLLLFACFATYVSLARPRGPLPATFGHLQTIADLLDEWDERMYWGHKETGVDGHPSLAGTSHRRLPLPFFDQLYGGYVPNINMSEEEDWTQQSGNDLGRLIKPLGGLTDFGIWGLKWMICRIQTMKGIQELEEVELLGGKSS